MEHRTWNLELRTWNLELGTWNLEHGTWNLELGTWNLEHGTWNLEYGTWNMELGILIKDERWGIDKSWDFGNLDLLFTLEVRGKGVSHNGGGAAKGERDVD